MRKTLTVAVLAAGLALATPATAQARPVLDPVIEAGDCGPGLEDRVFSLTDPRGYVITCRTEYLRPLEIPNRIRPGFDAWWNPWSWGR